MRLSPRNRFLALVAAGATVVSASACVKQNQPGVGLVKFDSSAVFGISSKDDTTLPGSGIPDFTDFVQGNGGINKVPNELPKPPSLCPDTPIGVFPKTAATVDIKGLPKEGLYRWQRNLILTKNPGVSGGVPVQRPFAIEKRAIRRVVKISDHEFSFQMVAADPTTSGRQVVTSFLVNNNPKLLLDQHINARTIGYTSIPGIDLVVPNPADTPGVFIVSIETLSEAGSIVKSFKPISPMMIAPLNEGVFKTGETFRSIGIDAYSGSVLVNDGIVNNPTRINACGEPIEGYSVTLHQTYTDDIPLDDPAATVDKLRNYLLNGRETRSADYMFATQYGLLPIQETLSVGNYELEPIAFRGKWQLGGVTPELLPASLK